MAILLGIPPLLRNYGGVGVLGSGLENATQRLYLPRADALQQQCGVEMYECRDQRANSLDRRSDIEQILVRSDP